MTDGGRATSGCGRGSRDAAPRPGAGRGRRTPRARHALAVLPLHRRHRRPLHLWGCSPHPPPSQPRQDRVHSLTRGGWRRRPAPRAPKRVGSRPATAADTGRAARWRPSLEVGTEQAPSGTGPRPPARQSAAYRCMRRSGVDRRRVPTVRRPIRGPVPRVFVPRAGRSASHESAEAGAGRPDQRPERGKH